jgi:cytochrome c oxidase subunit 2
LFVVIPHFIGGCSMADEKERVIQITAKKFEYSPNDIKVKKDVPVLLEFTSLDRLHGFNCPGLGIRSDIGPGKTTQLRFTPNKAGSFPFHCDNFCGAGHEGMTGTITVEE